MQNEVVQLRQKVKTLEKQLCQRTRNYLYHFKKSPIKRNQQYNDIQTQTDITSFVSEQIEATQIADNQFQNVHLVEFDQIVTRQKQAQIKQEEEKTDSGLQQMQKNYQLISQRIQNHPKVSITSQNLNNNQNYQKQIHQLTKQIQHLKNQLQMSSINSNPVMSNLIQSKFEHLNLSSQTKTPTKQSDTVTEFSKKKQIETVSDLSESKFNAQSSMVSTIEQDHHQKEIKILKKEIKKLKKRLQTEIFVSSQIKNALLISEDQNYKFRLQIQKLNKQIQILTGVFIDNDTENPKPFSFQDDQPIFKSVDSDQSQSTKQELQKFKSQTQKYEEYISILQAVKRDYLKRCIEAKQEICRLKQQIQLIKNQNQLLKLYSQKKQQFNQSQQSQNQSTKNSLLSQDTWLLCGQNLRQKIHEISNCLPLIGHQHEQFLFKPESIQDALQMLERILKFCKNIEAWQKQRIQCIEKERANLLKILSSLLVKHPDSKQTIADEIIEIDELKYLVNFMNKQPKSAPRSQQDLNPDHVFVPINESDPVETN